MTTKRTRQELRELFKQGAMPSGVDFSDLIESTLNRTDDGIDKPVGADQPLKIMAQGADENLLDFHTKEANTWRINQKTGGSKTGFNLSSLGVSRFFIERESGNVGIGEASPAARLHISQTGGAPALRVDDQENETTPFIIDSEGKVGVGTNNPSARLEVDGALKVNGAITSPEGVLRDDKGGWVRTYGATGWYSQTYKGGWYMKDNTWIRSYGDKSIYQNKGVLRTDGDLQVGLNGGRFIVKGANVGIGTNAPKGRLDVRGSLVFNGNENTKISGARRQGSDSVIVKGRWDELEIKGRVIDWTGTNLHIGLENDHSAHALYIGNGKLKQVEIQGKTDLIVGGKLNVKSMGTFLRQENWEKPDFKSNWENYSAEYNQAGYFKDSMGIVHLRGLVKSGSGVIFNLPSGYRPRYRQLHAVCTYPNAIGRLDILFDGKVKMQAGDKRWISLDGVTFRAR